ncbi:MAG: hypothetical protein R6V85_16990 [Polyangia bacterium]
MTSDAKPCPTDVVESERCPNAACTVGLLAVSIVSLAIGPARPVLAQRTVRVGLIDAEGMRPGAAAVLEDLSLQLAPLGVEVSLVEMERAPRDAGEWANAAEKFGREQPGSLALIGWSCPPEVEDDGEPCRLIAVETRRHGVMAIPLEAVSDGGDEAVRAVAATAREVVLGGVVSELERLAIEGERPSEAPDYARADGSSPRNRGRGGERNEWLWLEGGYHGEYPHPGDAAIHGPWLGLSAAPRPYVVPALSVGWLGVREADGAAGRAISHRLPIALAVRLSFPVGPARFALAPAGRLDVVFAEENPAGSGGEKHEVDVAMHAGGITSWHLPFPGGVQAVIGTGVMATVLDRDRGPGRSAEIGASAVRIYWFAGLAWSPLSG